MNSSKPFGFPFFPQSIQSRFTSTLLGIGALLIPLHSQAGSFIIQTESDISPVSNAVTYSSYDTYNDIVNGTLAGSSSVGITTSTSISTTGLAFNGSEYILMLETTDDKGSGEELLLVTFDASLGLPGFSLITSGIYSALDIDPGYTTTGLAFNGSQYILQLESDQDKNSGEELLYMTFNSYADLLSGTIANSVFAAISLAPSRSTTGLAFDGSQYILQTETDNDSGPLDEMLYSVFSGIPGVNGALVQGGVSAIDIPPTYSTTGLAYNINGVTLDNTLTVSVPVPATIFLLLAGIAGLMGISKNRVV